MVERELIFLMGYTALMSGAMWRTVCALSKLNFDPSGSGLGAVIAVCWVIYLLVAGFAGYTPIQLWMDYLEAHGVLYTSGALK